jgi:hypothetical protein
MNPFVASVLIWNRELYVFFLIYNYLFTCKKKLMVTIQLIQIFLIPPDNDYLSVCAKLIVIGFPLNQFVVTGSWKDQFQLQFAVSWFLYILSKRFWLVSRLSK